MKRSKRRVILISSLLISGACAASIAGSISLAGYVTSQSIVRTISAGVKPKKSIFLNANIWETDGPTYFMYVKKDSGSETRIEVSKKINPTVGENKLLLSVFEYDDVSYNKIKFQRFNSRYYGETAILKTDASVYKVVGPSGWNYGDSIADLYQDEKDSNHYVANHVTLAANAQLKIFDSTNWYSNNATWDNCHFTLPSGAGNNIQISTASTYTIDFYLNANNNNHVVFTDENSFQDYVWNETAWMDNDSSITSNYYCIQNWNTNTTPEVNELEIYNGSLRFKPQS